MCIVFCDTAFGVFMSFDVIVLFNNSADNSDNGFLSMILLVIYFAVMNDLTNVSNLPGLNIAGILGINIVKLLLPEIR